MKEAEGAIELKNRKVDAKHFTDKRNNRIIDFFTRRGLSVQLKGNPQNPMIVLNNSLCLSAYVSNFYLRFLDKPNQGNLVEEVKLTYNNVKHYPTKRLIEIIQNNEQLGMYKIVLMGTELSLVGYEHAARDNDPFIDNDLLYPVFGTLKPHLYKTLDMAQDVHDKIVNRFPIQIVKTPDTL